MTKFKKILSIMLTFVILVGIGVNCNIRLINAETIITDNYTKATAYNLGTWSSFNSAGTTAVMAADEIESWFKFTAASAEQIFIRVSSDPAYDGMSVQIKDSLGEDIGDSKLNPRNLIDLTSVTPSLYLNCGNTTNSTSTYYLVVTRGDYDSSSAMYFGFSAANRIRTGQETFSFSGNASNAGSGANSTELSLDLTNSTLIPNKAIVTSVTTSGIQSPKQGSVHHMINQASSTLWYTAIAASATGGSYTISLSNKYDAAQVWTFKYNALAGASSTMSGIKIIIHWQYDMTDTGYQAFTN